MTFSKVSIKLGFGGDFFVRDWETCTFVSKFNFMKKILLFLNAILIPILAFSQLLDQLPKNPTIGKCYISIVTPHIIDSKKVSYPVYMGKDILNKGLKEVKVIYEPERTTYEYQKHPESQKTVVCAKNHSELYEEILVVKKPKKTTLDFEWEEFEVKYISSKGGVRKWEEVECEYLKSSLLPLEITENKELLNASNQEIISDYLLEWLIETSLINIEITAHLNSLESDKLNIETGINQAEVIKRYLIESGIDKSRIHTNATTGTKWAFGTENWEGFTFKILH